ncbi:hypothetical protein FACS1894188_05370 [Clostridia bacterium]|nr:hypothetical protein FACS1894188_05370 [Clostridia bacterium]
MKTLEEKRTLSKWFEAKSNWFVLFVQTYEERRVAERLQGKLDNDKCVAFVSMRDRTYTQKDKTVPIKRVPLFGGYVFIATTEPETECLKRIVPIVQFDKTIYKVLRNDGKGETAKLSDRDKAVMTALLNEDFNIPALEAVDIGDRIEVLAGALEGIGGVVKSVDRRRHTAIVNLKLMG